MPAATEPHDTRKPDRRFVRRYPSRSVQSIRGLRQYFPKRTNLAVHTRADLDQVAAELNERPRLVLGDRTPRDVMEDFLAAQHSP
jgi:hypothetical protein